MSVGERFPLYRKIVVPSCSESFSLLVLLDPEDESTTVLCYISISLVADAL